VQIVRPQCESVWAQLHTTLVYVAHHEVNKLTRQAKG
jgi:hypothetical protein